MSSDKEMSFQQLWGRVDYLETVLAEVISQSDNRKGIFDNIKGLFRNKHHDESNTTKMAFAQDGWLISKDNLNYKIRMRSKDKSLIP